MFLTTTNCSMYGSDLNLRNFSIETLSHILNVKRLTFPLKSSTDRLTF